MSTSLRQQQQSYGRSVIFQQRPKSAWLHHRILPSHNTFRRFGGLGGLREALVRFAQERADNELLSKLGTPASIESLSGEAEREPPELQEGFVYLIKAGRRYKIGRASSVERRHRELAIQLPEPAEVIHRIRTDDPAGIEAYWHRRFADRRLNGEWFALSASDIKAFAVVRACDRTAS
jgi:hypothetical protein